MSNQVIVNSILLLIQEFREDKIVLRTLLDKLENLIHNLSLNYELKEKILETWDVMEEIYAGAADEGRAFLSNDEAEIIFETLDQLTKQLTQID